MLYNNLRYVNVANKTKEHTPLEFKNCNFQYIFLNWITSVIRGEKVTTFGMHVFNDNSEGTVSKILHV